MKIADPDVTTISTDWNKARFELNDQLESLTIAIKAGWQGEHNTDGSHSDVVADSVELQGAKVGEIFKLSYDSARFISEAGSSWSVQEGDIIFLRASRLGQLVFIQFNFYDTSLSTSTSHFLGIRVPEFHALPAQNSALGEEAQIGGSVAWQDSGGSGQGHCYARAEDFDGTIPSTVIYMSKPALTAEWDTGPIFVRGFCWFVVEPDNIGTPYFGS